MTVHYLVLPENLIVYSFITQESLKFICMILVCQYYSKAALAFLPSKNKWLLVLGILVLVGLSVMILGSTILII